MVGGPESNWDKRICNPLRNHSYVAVDLDKTMTLITFQSIFIIIE